MRVLVGLGNPGSKYAATRHNIGFLFLDYLETRYGIAKFRPQSRFRAEIAEAQIEGEKVLLVKPQTYMNLSGEAMALLQGFYSFSAEDLFVIQDDIDLPFGTVRYKLKSGHGGHNGLKSLFKQMGTQKFARIKMGIKNDLLGQIPTASFVLQKFGKEEVAALPEFFEKSEQLMLDNWQR